MTRNPRYLYLLIALLCAAHLSYALSEEDKNVTITNQKERYAFEAGDKENPVIIRQNTTTTWLCSQFRTTVPFVEFYDSRSKIDEVRAFVNGKREKALKPVFRDYTVDDIFYSDAKMCIMEVPLERNNTESSVELEKTILDPRYFSAIYFSNPYVTDLKVIEVVIPRWMKAEIREMNFGQFSIKKEVIYDARRDEDVYRYTAVHYRQGSMKRTLRGLPIYIRTCWY